jgi:hypothetical protein
MATTLVLAVVAVYLVVSGERIRSAYADVSRCRPPGSGSCRFSVQNFHDSYSQPGLAAIMLLLLPGLVGAFAGAPVLARELESGTFRYAWTQGVGRVRWATAVVVPGALGAAGLMAAFGALVTWYDQPLVDSGIRPRLHGTVFPITGLAGAGWAALGFALGVLAGVLWRRVIPALATALGVWFGLALLAADVLRPHYLSPLTTSRLTLSGKNLTLDHWWTRNGVQVSEARLNEVLHAIGFQDLGADGKVTVEPGHAGHVDPVQYLLEHGYRQVTSYQPGTRYWTFQWIEFGWLIALVVLLLGSALWVLRRMR